ncbi:MAG TPA: NusG domain II-containing protein [Candidatus Krumholzibacteria bacterium]|nr:NusG domain II-containing protein [Candidatus Krumholzibacteria bacterium]HPD70514.1 NusG domain II-containing protein [Candidatus Krumholzibacteria bacterium]HRY39786.1 NusG domain II-containing protein [Candidatus Krumholzibacteria bacterium]
MLNRRDFLKAAVIGGAAFGAGFKLGDLGRADAGRRLVLHGFVPGDETAVRDLVDAFLSLSAGPLPVPQVDAPAAWRAAVGGALRGGARRYARGGRQVLTVQLGALERALPADLLVQAEGRILDPAGGVDDRILALRERFRGTSAALVVSCRLENRPDALAQERVLVVEDERGVQERLPLAGASRRLEIAGPAGRTVVAVDAAGARVAAACCRHATCRLQGVVARPGELIACAPNRVVLRVETA